MSAATPTLALNLWDTHGGKNINLRIEDLNEKLWRDIPPQFQDLLEMAAYVYCCDQTAIRGQHEVDSFGGHWKRRFHFHVPVRVPELWNSAGAKKLLVETLEFLSDDFYDFSFYPAKDAPQVQQLFDFDRDAGPVGQMEQVMMFSGGLDSLAGAIEEICTNKHRVLLVNHRSTPKFSLKHQELQRLLAAKAGANVPSHMHVRISKDSTLGKEYTQRARSFLFAALGATVAMMVRVKRLRFYENGIVSLNLPVCAQVVGGRATRTTHPKVLDGLQKLLTLVANEPFAVENPFVWTTKGDVVKKIVQADCGPMIAYSRSCAHTWDTSNTHTHCGVCSQCIDRRFGMVAAKAEQFDPLDQYKIDIFTEARPKDEDKIMGAAYLERANQVGKLRNATQMVEKYPEVIRVLRHLGGSVNGAAERVFDLYRRHAGEVNEAVDALMDRHKTAIRERTLPGECLLRTVFESGAVTSLPAKPVVPPNGEHEGPDGEKPRYLLRKGAGIWRVVFDGKEGEIEHGRGIDLVAYLLFNPPQGGIHGTRLGAAVFGHAVVEEANMGSDSDPARRKILKEAEECRDILNDPTASETTRDEAVAKLEELAKVLNVTRSDSQGNAEKQVRAIRRAIERLIEKLREAKDRQNNPHQALRAFGEHLHKHLWVPSSRFSGTRHSRVSTETAGQFTYERPPDINWEE
ncbi:7-cyano-7-deazaguanine synthase [Fontisphaera persica]|uniref:7-cyano-7-deazaguanine synthase n=1 Tax=Fontisphaera persica TaxID=2974023 RepID=UPI0024BF58EA|nr:7-cyano-7-deazaguanine synthase [Fontisphaera persica]WCJ60323.1 7-cyano-7-deazaguanine synthase [Fontisphaera persica]